MLFETKYFSEIYKLNGKSNTYRVMTDIVLINRTFLLLLGTETILIAMINIHTLMKILRMLRVLKKL